MTLTERQVGSVTVIDLEGRLTTENAGRLKDKVASLLFQGQKQIVMNLANLTYMDSAGLGEMVACHSTASRQEGRVKLVNVGKRIEDLLILTRLLTVFDVLETEEDAIRSFEG
jgi:anti-sigma B factor antagonist